MTADDYLKRAYARLLIPNDDGTFSAEILEFTGCFAQGDTAAEAIVNVNSAAREWIEAAQRQRLDIPEPFTTRGYSGTVSLRLPKALHRQAARMAQRDGTSLNQFLLSAIAERVGAEATLQRLSDKLHQAQLTINAIFLTEDVAATEASMLLPLRPKKVVSSSGQQPSSQSLVLVEAT